MPGNEIIIVRSRQELRQVQLLFALRWYLIHEGKIEAGQQAGKNKKEVNKCEVD